MSDATSDPARRPAEPATEAPFEPLPEPLLEGTPEPGFTTAGVPTFDHVRERIEGRAATADGAGELDAALPEVASAEQRERERADAGRARLEEIRRAMGSG